MKSGFAGRREDHRLLAGQGDFIGNVVLPGLLQCAFVRSEKPHAALCDIDVSAAEDAPGVVAVLLAEDLPHVGLIDSVRLAGLHKTPQSCLADGRVRYEGEPIAIVIARTRYHAEDAAESVRVTYEALPAHFDARVAATSSELLFPDTMSSNVVFSHAAEYGDVETAFARADIVVRRSLSTGRCTAAPMEPRGCVASYRSGTGLEVWSPTQAPEILRRRLAVLLGEPENRVRVRVPRDVGGAFGQKLPLAPEEAAVALASRRLERPIRWIEDRRENLIAAPQAKEQHIEIEVAATSQGRITAMRAQFTADAGAYSFNTSSAAIEPLLSGGLLGGPYAVKNLAYTACSVLTNKTPIAPYRGVGWTAVQTARELVIDDLALDLGIDPFALRLANLVPASAMPYRTANGMLLDSGDYPEALRRAWAGITRDHAPRATEGSVRGYGMSPYIEPSGFGTQGTLQSDWPFPSTDAVRLRLDASGGVTIAVGTPSQGQGHETVLCDVVAQQLGIPHDRIVLVCSDSALMPASSAGTRSSRVAVVTAGAVTRACGMLADRLVDIGAIISRRGRDSLVVKDGALWDGGERLLEIADIAAVAHFDPALRDRTGVPDLEVIATYDPPGATYSNGCVAVAVSVDTRTGRVSVDDVVVVEDCGTMLNETIVDGQLLGAIAQGIGLALHENVAYGSVARRDVATFGHYLIPRATDVPDVQVHHMCSPSPWTENGAKGMGESGMIATPAAVINAVRDATRSADGLWWPERLPVQPEDVLVALRRSSDALEVAS